MEKLKFSLYRVYGYESDGNSFDEYCCGKTAQEVADKVRENNPGYTVIEIAKVVKRWK